MLKRKIERRLEKFYSDPNKSALLIDGARQVGKSFIVESFGRSHYESVVTIDFLHQEEARAIFTDVTDASEILTRITAFSRQPLIPGKTLVFFDEIQECVEVVTYIKYLVQEGSCRYILSGSLLGVEIKNVKSEPVGYMDDVTMYPMDFEEFVLAVGERPELLNAARSAWENDKPLAKVFHDRLSKLLRLYLVVGGMPAVVQRYVDTKDIRQVVDEQKKILKYYRKDISKYDERNALRIRAVFDRLAPELNDKNKRFYADSVGEVGRFDRLADEFLWLKEAGVAIPAFNVEEPKQPLILARRPNFFKLFMNDVGLLAALYMDGIQLKILNGETDINFGAIYENFVAQELKAHGFEPNYYNSAKFGELDFVVEYKTKVLPIEVKSGKHDERHRALTRIMEVAEYGLDEALVFTEGSFDRKGRLRYLPVYQVMFLEKEVLPETMVYELPPL
ncbi:MAG: ATP-binding protein [Kiritimatiellae bacterium]|nr:ATP-binding protein [Kiritimatiellia bacterium]